MIYAISDIHGRYEKYRDMLETIERCRSIHSRFFDMKRWR